MTIGKDLEIAAIVQLLRNDPSVGEKGDIEVVEGDICVITDIPCREDDEDWESYCKRVGVSPRQEFTAGLGAVVVEMATALGWDVQVNDCPGCENEAMFHKD